MQADDGELPGEGLPCRFGKYTLIRKLATGGMAELFLAIQKSVAGFEKLVVIKRILPPHDQDRAFVEMFLHEARVAATMSHPNIVQIFDVGSVDGTYFIAMEHVHGEDLRSIVRQMKRKDVVEFPMEHALSIVLGLCAGLAYAHEKRDLDGTPLNIVHRDISPQNVVVTFGGDVKLVDFGIAKSDVRFEDASKSGPLKGKIPYMSPEQARGEPIDWRSDIFAVGVVLFELTTGKRLFKGTSEYDTLKLICEREYPLPSQATMAYPRELEVIVMRALQKDREKRWQSAREMQAAIEEFVRDQRLAVSTIALSKFMQELFQEKLASQKEALLQGKQLADIIALEGNADSVSGIDVRASPSSSRVSVRSPAQHKAARSRGVWMGIGGVAAVLGVVGAGIAWSHRPHGDVKASLGAPVAMETPVQASAAPSETPPPPAPVVSQDTPDPAATAPAIPPAPATTTDRKVAASPHAEKTPPATPAVTPAGTGKLNVAARGGWCNVTIDGVPRGPTPVAGVVLPAGPHTVTCTPEGGRPQTATVRVDPDGIARYSFSVPQ